VVFTPLLPDRHRWYSSILRGHYGYYGVSHNFPALSAFHGEVRRIWLRCLRRRSQKARCLNWDRVSAMLERFPLPDSKITHPWTMSVAWHGSPSGRAGCGKAACPDL